MRIAQTLELRCFRILTVDKEIFSLKLSLEVWCNAMTT